MNDLSHWTFSLEEVSPSVYKASAVHHDGRTIARTGNEKSALEQQVRQDAANMDSTRGISEPVQTYFTETHGNLEPLPPLTLNAPIIQVRALTKTFRVGEVGVNALQGVDLQVARGEFLAIIGTSGSGKSTLFNILGGLTPPTSGSVSINGRDLSHMTNTQRNDLRKRTVGFVFQKYNLLPTLTAEQNIQIVRHVASRPIAFDAQFKEILHMLGIEARMQHKPRALSGGEQQRVAIARAIVNGPAILLADEPTGNLDSKNSDVVLNLLRDLNKRLGQTILMITHNPEAAAYADRTVQMRDGKVL